MAFYDLTTHEKPEMSIRTLLGLGPNFYVQPKGSQGRNTSKMINRFKRDTTLKIYLMSNISVTDEETPRLYRKNKMATTKSHRTNRCLSKV